MRKNLNKFIHIKYYVDIFDVLKLNKFYHFTSIQIPLLMCRCTSGLFVAVGTVHCLSNWRRFIKICLKEIQKLLMGAKVKM